MPRPGGPGKPLKLLTKPVRPDIPLYVASLGPANVRIIPPKPPTAGCPPSSSRQKAHQVWGRPPRGGRRTAGPGARPAADVRGRPARHRRGRGGRTGTRATQNRPLRRRHRHPGKNYYNDLAVAYGYGGPAHPGAVSRRPEEGGRGRRTCRVLRADLAVRAGELCPRACRGLPGGRGRHAQHHSRGAGADHLVETVKSWL